MFCVLRGEAREVEQSRNLGRSVCEGVLWVYTIPTLSLKRSPDEGVVRVERFVYSQMMFIARREVLGCAVTSVLV